MSRIIVVDDAHTDRVLISGLLKREMECDVQAAENGEAALDYIDAERPDIVLTDLQMPGMDGLELLQAIKDEYPMIPVVLMTAQGSENIAANAMKAGATSYVPKRRLAEDLGRTVKRIIAAAQDAMVPPQLMHRLDYTNCQFTLSNDPVQIASVVAHLQRMLRCLPLQDESERIRVGLALEAALSNALYHGNMEASQGQERPDEASRTAIFRKRWNQEPYCHRRITLTAEISREEAKFVVADEGPGFDTSHLEPEVMTLDTEGGRGLPLMYTIMDSVTFNDTGNEVTLIRYKA